MFGSPRALAIYGHHCREQSCVDYVNMVFAALAVHLGESEMGKQLQDLCDLIHDFVDPKHHQSGDGFEMLFACAFCGFCCTPFFPSFTEPWAFHTTGL